jgi:hypothetical protein
MKTQHKFPSCDLLSNIALITFDTQLTIKARRIEYGCDLLSNIALITFDTQQLCLSPLLTRSFNDM